jgi:hypothetical protein
MRKILFSFLSVREDLKRKFSLVVCIEAKRVNRKQNKAKKYVLFVHFHVKLKFESKKKRNNMLIY